MATMTEKEKGLRHETPVKDLMRQSNLERLASTPEPEQYDTVNSCDGHTWRRRILTGGKYGNWEDMGPTKK